MGLQDKIIKKLTDIDADVKDLVAAAMRTRNDRFEYRLTRVEKTLKLKAS